jgi:hypothetical protein
MKYVHLYLLLIYGIYFALKFNFFYSTEGWSWCRQNFSYTLSDVLKSNLNVHTLECSNFLQWIWNLYRTFNNKATT